MTSSEINPYAPPETLLEEEVNFFIGAEYEITFGGNFQRDGCHFHGKGVIRLSEDFLVVDGRVVGGNLTTLAFLFGGVCLMIVLAKYIGVFVLFILALVFYLARSKKKTIALKREGVKILPKRGKTLKFWSTNVQTEKSQTSVMKFRHVTELAEVVAYFGSVDELNEGEGSTPRP